MVTDITVAEQRPLLIQISFLSFISSILPNLVDRPIYLLFQLSDFSVHSLTPCPRGNFINHTQSFFSFFFLLNQKLID